MRRAAWAAALGAVTLAGLAPPAGGRQDLPAGPQTQTTYAGGWVGARHHLWLRGDVDETGERVALLGRVETPCGAGDLQGTAAATPDRGLTASGMTRQGSTALTWRLGGRLALGGGSGMLDATLTVRRRGRAVRRCTVRGRRWAIAYASSAHQSGPPPAPGSRWHGYVEGNGMTALWVDPRRSRVRAMLVGVDLSWCPGRRPRRFWGVVRDAPIDPTSPGFRATRRYTVRQGAVRRRVELRVDGLFFSDGVSTSVSVREITSRGGRRVSACDTGLLSGYSDDIAG